ncbi:DUF1206 domain-containing protein [Streptomyces sp. NPDC006465]|uniref:DUF1206 domain-containing protein n=1 Tax=Streptomyces sp. NPDC006465 TaxID=3157174 RepID=UPI0033B7AEED
MRGSRSSKSQTSKEYTARVLNWPGGRVLIGMVGAVLVVIGGEVPAVRSGLRKFEKSSDRRDDPTNAPGRHAVGHRRRRGRPACSSCSGSGEVRPQSGQEPDETLRSFADTPARP